MKLSKETLFYQRQLAQYCRTGVDDGITMVTKNRMQEYRRLVKNTVNNSLNKAFPIASKHLGPSYWQTLCNDFFIKHDSQTPQIWKMPFEFYLFVKTSAYQNKWALPYLDELLYFEWLEIEIFTMVDAPPKPIVSDFQKEENNEELYTREYKLVHFNYPVHLKKYHKLKQHKGNYFLLIFREWISKTVQCINLGFFSALFLEGILEQGLSVKASEKKSCDTLGLNYNEYITKQTQSLIGHLKKKKFILT